MRLRFKKTDCTHTFISLLSKSFLKQNKMYFKIILVTCRCIVNYPQTWRLKTTDGFWISHFVWALRSRLAGSFQLRVSQEFATKMSGVAGGWSHLKTWRLRSSTVKLPHGLGQGPKSLTTWAPLQGGWGSPWHGTWLPSVRVTQVIKGKVEATMFFMTWPYKSRTIISAIFS